MHLISFYRTYLKCNFLCFLFIFERVLIGELFSEHTNIYLVFALYVSLYILK